MNNVTITQQDIDYLESFLEKDLKPKLQSLSESELKVVEKYAVDFFTLGFMRVDEQTRHSLSLSMLDYPDLLPEKVSEIDFNYFNMFFEKYVQPELRELLISESLSEVIKASGLPCYKQGILKAKSNIKDNLSVNFSES